MRKNPRRLTAAAAVCSALLGAAGLLAPSAQAQVPVSAKPGPAVAATDRSQRDATPPGGEVESTTVTRPDGTQAQVAIFSTSAVNETLWYQTQLTPGGAFGAWSQIGTVQVNFQNPVLSAAADADGSLEVFTLPYESGGLLRLSQAGENGPWSAPESFAPAGTDVPRFFGYPVLFQRADGTLAFFEVYQGAGVPELYVNEQSAPGVWGSWTDLGAGPLPASVATPSFVTQAADGTLTVVAHMWDASSYSAEISELTPGGAWGPWQNCGTGACPAG
ncbi:hypothetical protein ACIGXM_08900 [Kitasatospora sp. NPDC052896]|uniref:hypothetical protein n=1 Tax=Kitasatospora sp. NPDC052896 TaxID=3364061 RepID=UPI0037C6E06B